MPVVSVCLPVFNGERYLSQAIESVLDQDFKSFELIISDNASSDSTLKIAQEYAKKDSRIRLWSNPKNIGPLPNYNVCLNLATGDYIKPFAYDDLWKPTILSEMLSAFRSMPDLNLVSVHCTDIDDNNTPVKPLIEQVFHGVVSGAVVEKEFLLSFINWIGEPSKVMFPRPLIGKGFNNNYYHLGDIEYWLRIIGQETCYEIPKPLCLIRRHQESFTHASLKELLFALDILQFGHDYKNSYRKLELSEYDVGKLAVEKISTFVYSLVKSGLTPDEVTVCQIAPEQALSQLKGFKELSFYALLYAAESIHTRSINSIEETSQKTIALEKWFTKTGALKS